MRKEIGGRFATLRKSSAKILGGAYE
jgi:hypothetical protein